MNQDKFTFPQKTVLDEWNPHIVRHIRRGPLDFSETDFNEARFIRDGYPEKIKKELLAKIGENRAEALEANSREWVKQWDLAQGILREVNGEGIYPLAYRLDTNLSGALDVDPIEGSKFGGVPDFRYTYRFQHSGGKTPLEVVSNLWPKCGGCNEHMNFLGGVDLSDWLIPIHVMTGGGMDSGPKVTSLDLKSSQYSGVGFGRTICSDSSAHRPFFQMFYCNEPHFDSPAFDSMIHAEQRYEGDKGKVMNVEEYRDVVSQFVKDNGIESNISIRSLEGVALKFDLDIPGEDYGEDWMYDVEEDHPEIFGREGDYQFFGKPESQQGNRRFACQNTYHGLHRMGPIVNWTDRDHDFTYQVDGCLKCLGQESNQVYCKTDGSCT